MVEPGKRFDLSKQDPRDASAFEDKDLTKAQVAEDAIAIDAWQNRLYAEGKQSLLVVLQGIDCAGKDGTVRAVFNTCGPIGVKVDAADVYPKTWSIGSDTICTWAAAHRARQAAARKNA